jgi:hypothetical protein
MVRISIGLHQLLVGRFTFDRSHAQPARLRRFTHFLSRTHSGNVTFPRGTIPISVRAIKPCQARWNPVAS